ncbi:MAG: PKD domain-containing protein, partial [Planctomycetaceae bacterium]|nr:PKD domain-containing protein [Planctomycetaceae bacterium]
NTESEPVAATGDATIPAGTNLELFESKRKDANQPEPFMEWDFPVTSGTAYEVRLYFVELSRCSVGARTFQVDIEGVNVLSDFDVYAEAGNACNVATMRDFIITPADANLDISFPLGNGKPSTVAAIEILEAVTTAPDIRTAQVNIEHTGTNGTQIVQLTGEATDNPGGVPVAAFSFAVNDLEVTFTDESTDDGTIVSWDWDLGDTNSSTDQNPVHNYAAYGTYTVTLTVTDDLGFIGNISHDVLVADPNATGPFLEQAGMAVMEAENFDTNTANGDMWVETTSQADFSGTGAMESTPDDGDLIKKNSVSSSPHMTYDVDFTTTGSYIVWVRLFAVNADAGTIHAGINGNPSASKMETTTIGAWTWTNVNTKSALQTIAVTSAGVNTIDIWMREDGSMIDKIILTTDAGFVPAGQGPAESPRGALTQKERGENDMLVIDDVIDLPTEFDLKANYPNPFNPTTNIAFDLPEATDVKLEVYDMMGRRVATLINGQLNAGRYNATWNARSDAGSMVASGVYIYRLRAGSFESVKQMVLMK